MNRSVFLAIVIAVSLLVIGCSSDKKEEKATTENSIIVENNISVSHAEETNGSSASDNIVNDEQNKAVADESESIDVDNEASVFESPYHFYDVFRNEYEMEIDTRVPVNTLKAENYKYIGKDELGNTLSEIEITPDTDIFVNGTEAVGYTGIIKYEDDTYISKWGIDVSKFQGNINWDKVKASGVQFVFVRVGFRGYGQSGSLSEDVKYRQNIEGALNAGLDVGVYFYAQAINEQEAIEEAEFVSNLISEYKINLPVVYDPEHVLNDDARTDNISGEQFTANTIAFCNRIKELGYEPMVYANMLWESMEFDLSRLSDVKIWYADYELKPQSPYRFEVWQYSQGGKIPGIDGTVDLNMMIVHK